jgi:hypothetical protein
MLSTSIKKPADSYIKTRPQWKILLFPDNIEYSQEISFSYSGSTSVILELTAKLTKNNAIKLFIDVKKESIEQLNAVLIKENIQYTKFIKDINLFEFTFSEQTQLEKFMDCMAGFDSAMFNIRSEICDVAASYLSKDHKVNLDEKSATNTQTLNKTQNDKLADALHGVAIGKPVADLKALLNEYGIEPNKFNYAGHTAFTYVIDHLKFFDKKLVNDFYMKYGADLFNFSEEKLKQVAKNYKNTLPKDEQASFHKRYLLNAVEKYKALFSVLELLLTNNANINSYCSEGHNPLSLAINNDDLILVHYLLQKGAQVHPVTPKLPRDLSCRWLCSGVPVIFQQPINQIIINLEHSNLKISLEIFNAFLKAGADPYLAGGTSNISFHSLLTELMDKIEKNPSKNIANEKAMLKRLSVLKNELDIYAEHIRQIKKAAAMGSVGSLVKELLATQGSNFKGKVEAQLAPSQVMQAGSLSLFAQRMPDHKDDETLARSNARCVIL